MKDGGRNHPTFGSHPGPPPSKCAPLVRPTKVMLRQFRRKSLGGSLERCFGSTKKWLETTFFTRDVESGISIRNRGIELGSNSGDHPKMIHLISATRNQHTTNIHQDFSTQTRLSSGGIGWFARAKPMS